MVSRETIETFIKHLLPSRTELHVAEVTFDDDDHLTITARVCTTTACCPQCGQATTRIHSHYTRTVTDVPWGTCAVRLVLHVRKFFCVSSDCARQIFTERLPTMMTPWARRTTRLAAQQQHLGLTVGAAAGARLADDLHQGTGRTTLLRLMRRAPIADPLQPRVLGIDEFALRKGQHYGSLLVDLERRAVVDVLPDRADATFAAWLRAHPGVEIISRDRATVYATGATAGAPEAMQVADRFHLRCNFSDALQRLIDRHATVLRDLARQHDADDSCASMRETLAPGTLDARGAHASQRTNDGGAAPFSRAEERYRAVKALQERGLGQREIARQLAMHRRTVRRYMLAETFPTRAVGRQSVSSVRPYLPYLLQRWADGRRERRQLWREIRDQGYTGSYASVYRALAHLPSRSQSDGPTPVPKRRSLSARKATWLLVQPIDDLTARECAVREQLCERCADAATAYPLAQRFCTMIRMRQAEALDVWLSDAETSGIPELRNFAGSLRRDYAAVRAALALPWSTGPVEGHINRVKMLKRQTYGRAKFDLLRQRILLA